VVIFPASAEHAEARRPTGRVLHRGIALLRWMGSTVTVAALLVLATAVGALADGVPAGKPTVTATYDR
jgi:hypothetical protein